MISQLDGYDGLPIDSQVDQTCATCHHYLWIVAKNIYGSLEKIFMDRWEKKIYQTKT